MNLRYQQLFALSRLLDFSSKLKFGENKDDISFNDPIGKISIKINKQIMSNEHIDIFKKNISYDEIENYESIVNRLIYNYTFRKIITRDVSDEIKIVNDSFKISNDVLRKNKISIANSLQNSNYYKFIEKKEVLKLNLDPDFVFLLPGDELKNQYFTSTKVQIKDKSFILNSILSHDENKENKLSISSFILLFFDEYEAFYSNPSQLFLKALDKFGIDMKIGPKVSRYYYKVSVPINTNIDKFEFLNFQNKNLEDDFIISITFKKNLMSFDLTNVYAINYTKVNEALHQIL